MRAPLKALWNCVGIGLSAALLGSCSNGSTLWSQWTGSSSPTQQVPTTTSPSTTQADLAQVPAQDVTCEGRSHVIRIVWSQGQPLLTFYRKPDDVTINLAPSTYARNSDGSLTYTYTTATTTTLTVYANNTCFMQVVGSSGAIEVSEEGQLVSTEPSPPESPSPPGSPSPSPISPLPSPGPVVTSLICRGNIQNRIDFTVDYTQASGFSRVEFRPLTSNTLLRSNLSYAGRNQNGQEVWRGSVNAAADVVVIHLSQASPRSGDLVAVSYDGQWGQGYCGTAPVPGMW